MCVCVMAPWVNWQIVLMFDKERFIKSVCFFCCMPSGPISTKCFHIQIEQIYKNES